MRYITLTPTPVGIVRRPFEDMNVAIAHAKTNRGACVIDTRCEGVCYGPERAGDLLAQLIVAELTGEERF